MKKFLLIFITILIFSTPLKTEEAIVGTVDGMFCIAFQEHLQTALKEEFGEQAVITVSWEDGLAVVSIPSKGKITEKAFKKVVENEGFIIIEGINSSISTLLKQVLMSKSLINRSMFFGDSADSTDMNFISFSGNFTFS